MLAVVVAALGLGAASPRPDPRICQPLPTEWSVSPAGVASTIRKARASAPAHLDVDEAAAAARDRAMGACLHRYGYLLARTDAPAPQVAAAAFNRCDDLQRYSADVLAGAALANKPAASALKLEKSAMLDQAARRVIEARAGACWLK